jgi:cadmium resistance protein CadD (predicted permease)
MERLLYYGAVTEKTEFERETRGAYLREFIPSVAGYVVVLAGSLAVVGGDKVDSVGEWILVLLPIIPALWGVRAIVRQLRRIDEYQRMLQLESMAAGFGVAMVAAITLGFVGAAGTATIAAGWIVYTAGVLTWAVCVIVRGRR